VIRVLFVCMGNICRSPTAEGVFKHLVAAEGLSDRIESDSAGTHDYHVGDPPDSRSQAAAALRGYDLSLLRARQVRVEDFADFDYVLAMDEAKHAALRKLSPKPSLACVKLFLDFAAGSGRREVPDPYYGGTQGFEEVLDLVEDAARGLLEHIKAAGLR